MPRAIWSGSLSFGLVNVPVKVVSAVQQKEVRFNQIHAADGGRVEMKRFCTAGDHEVPYEEITKGYKLGGDEYVTVSKEELEQIAPGKSETIDIVDFVDLLEIDPIYYEKPYYLIPDKGGAKAYMLLEEAMNKSGRVAIARFVMRSREHLVAVRPMGKVLTMTTLNYHDEVVDQAALEGIPEKGKVSERELDMAQKLIDALTTTFDPEKYTDEYREQVLALIEAKAEGKEVVAAPAAKPAKTKDLVEALQASLEAARTGKGSHSKGHAKA